MKTTLSALFFCIAICSYSQNIKNTSSKATTPSKNYSSKDITNVFDAHGGKDNWDKMKSLTFTHNSNGAEVTTVNLKTRAELIDRPNYTQGFDGKTLWVKEKDNKPYKGNAKFYKGLMFYFYAMPFVLGDDGILYDDIEPLMYQGKAYPGVLISFVEGTGASPNDQYKVYYNEETGRMEWLAYTVTYGKNEKSTKFYYIKYDKWKIVNGFSLPKAITWYTVENNMPKTLRSTIEFSNVVVSNKAPDKSLFEQPEGARIIE